MWEALLAGSTWPVDAQPERARGAAVALAAAFKERAPSIRCCCSRRHPRSVHHPVDRLTTEQFYTDSTMDRVAAPTIRRGEQPDGRGLSQRLAKYNIGSKLHAAGERVCADGRGRPVHRTHGRVTSLRSVATLGYIR